MMTIFHIAASVTFALSSAKVGTEKVSFREEVWKLNEEHECREIFRPTRRLVLASFATTVIIPSRLEAYEQRDNIISNVSTIHIRLESSQQRLGIEMAEAIIGSPPRSVAIVKSLDPFGLAAKRYIESGMILKMKGDQPVESYVSNVKDIVQRIRNGPYPIDFKFMSLAAGGDAVGDLGKSLVAAEDALELAKQTSGASSVASKDGANENRNSGYIVKVLSKSDSDVCSIRSRRGDVMEIQYTASYYNKSGGDNGDNLIVYDSSFQRGTGQPYQFVLGSGDMLAGVDLGLYDMCPGEVRNIEIPKSLGYGDKGNKMFRIPGDVKLVWRVELISVNSTRE